ncbi:hypothetical protein GCM10023186_04530 [Hymenobacter koreensis]|uniref:Uncharacterized protein n=2 Tax=Hymenobacter koreensis TaxID=1084523 RepID=A0ABP8IUC1_9BACT
MLVLAAAPVWAQTHLVDLTGQTLATPLLGGTITQIIDARPDHSTIGQVYTGLDYVRTEANLKRSLETEFLSLLRTLPVSTGSSTFALRVHQLHISENLAGSKKATAELVVDFLLPQEANRFRVVFRASGLAESGGLDINGKHPLTIAKALQNCLIQFNTTGAVSPSDAQVLTLEQAQTPEPNAGPLVPYPITLTKAPNPGLYRTFDDFRNNNPETTGARPVIISRTPRERGEWAGIDDVEVFYLGDNNVRTPVRDAWGYCDGERTYVLHRRRFCALEPNGNRFTFYGPSAADRAAVTSSTLAAGLIGTAIATAATSGHKQFYRMSLLTGHIEATADEEWAADAPDSTSIVVYRRADVKQPLAVQLNGGAVGDLQESSFVAVPWTDKRKQAQLCVGGEAVTCSAFQPSFAGTNYFEYLPKTASRSTAELKPVTVKEGEFYVKRLRLQQRHREVKAKKS